MRREEIADFGLRISDYLDYNLFKGSKPKIAKIKYSILNTEFHGVKDGVARSLNRIGLDLGDPSTHPIYILNISK